jgi:hypothetical protein
MEFSFFFSGTESTITAPTTGLQPLMMDDDNECRAIDGMLDKGNRSTWRKSASVPLCPPQISHDLTRARLRSPPLETAD